MERQNLKTLYNLLNEAKVQHGIAEKGYSAHMTAIEADYGIKTLAQAKERIAKLDNKILQEGNERDALLAQAQSILEGHTMEGSHGNTKTHRQRNQGTVGTTGRDAVVGRGRASRGVQSPRQGRKTR